MECHVVVEVEITSALLAEIAANRRCDDAGISQRIRRQGVCTFRRLRCGDQQLVCERDRNPAPEWRAFGGKLGQALRYGENAHQSAALYVSDRGRVGVATANQLQGKELSYNNINDTDAAFELVRNSTRSSQLLPSSSMPIRVVLLSAVR